MNTHQIATELRDLAGDWHWEAEKRSGNAADEYRRGRAQILFVAVLVDSAADGFYDDMGLAWLTAGHRLLARLLERARMDEVHESRASRRAEKVADHA